MEISKEREEELNDLLDTSWEVSPKLMPLKSGSKGIKYHGRRIVIIDTETFLLLRQKIEKILGKEIARRVLYEEGVIAGKEIAKMFVRMSERNIFERLKLLIKIGDLNKALKLKDSTPIGIFYKGLGYGKYAGWIEEGKLIEENEKFILRGKNLFEVRNYPEKKSKEPVCDFMRGISVGLISVFWKKENLVSEETKCQAMGDPYCEFVVYPKSG